jgi:hypothetical protein
VKNIGCFYPHKRHKDGLDSECKECKKAKQRTRNANLTEEGIAKRNRLARQLLATHRVSVPVPDLPDEEWRDVVDLEGLYMVSNLGRVKALPQPYGGNSNRRREYLVKSYPDIHGYPKVHLAKDGTKPHLFVHRLVAAAFIGPRPEGQVVNHLNGDVADARPENLEYVTQSGNMQHARKVLGWKGSKPPLLAGERNNHAKLTAEQVVEIRRLAATGQYTHKEIGRMFGIQRSPVGNIVHRRIWKHVP